MQQPNESYRAASEAAVFGADGLPMRSLPFWDGLQWWIEAWSLVSREPWRWTLTIVVFLVLCAAALLIPYLGALLQHFLQTILIGGVMFGFHSVAQGRRLELAQLFAGFGSPYLKRLCVAIVILTVAFIVFFLVVGVVLAMLGLSLDMTHLTDLTDAGSLPVILLLLLMLILAVSVIGMFYWFAPALIMLHNVGALEALRLSFVASLRNIGPMLSFSIAALFPMLIALVPLGMIGSDRAGVYIGITVSVVIGTVLGTMLLGAMYVSTERIFAPVPVAAD